MKYGSARVSTGDQNPALQRYYWLLLAESHLTRQVLVANRPADLGAAFTGGVRAGGLRRAK